MATEPTEAEIEAATEAAIQHLHVGLDYQIDGLDEAIRAALAAAAQVRGTEPWLKNVVMSPCRDENGHVIGVEGMFMVRTPNVGQLPGSLRAAAEALLERAPLMPIYSATEDT